MLEDLLMTIDQMPKKEDSIIRVDNKLFIKNGAMGAVVNALLEIVGSKIDLHKTIRSYFFEETYYYVSDKRTLKGYVLELPQSNLSLPIGSGRLLSTAETLLKDDPDIQPNTETKLILNKTLVAEVRYGVRNPDYSRLITLRAFDRFVRRYRYHKRISLLDCLFEMARYIRKAHPSQDEQVLELKARLDSTYRKNRAGVRMNFFEVKNPLFLYYSRGKYSWIFVLEGKKITYSEPTVTLK